MRPDRGIILAAGFGTRLRWLTRAWPKALMRVQGRPIIEHVILRLASYGVRHIAINLHYHAEAIQSVLGDGGRFGVTIAYSREARLLDSGGGIRTALEHLPEGDRFVVHNADVFADVDLAALADECPNGGACLALVRNPPHHPQGDFELKEDGWIDASAGGGRYTYAGVAVMHDACIADFPPGHAFPLRDVWRALAGAGRLRGRIHDGFWLDVGRPRDLLWARMRGVRHG